MIGEKGNFEYIVRSWEVLEAITGRECPYCLKNGGNWLAKFGKKKDHLFLRAERRKKKSKKSE